jgi:hypothetical protein
LTRRGIISPKSRQQADVRSSVIQNAVTTIKPKTFNDSFPVSDETGLPSECLLLRRDSLNAEQPRLSRI